MQRAAGFSLSGRRIIPVNRLAATKPLKTTLRRHTKMGSSSAPMKEQAGAHNEQSDGAAIDTPSLRVPELRLLPGSTSGLEPCILKHTTASSATGVVVVRGATTALGLSDSVVSALVHRQEGASLWSFEQPTNPRGTDLRPQLAFLQAGAIKVASKAVALRPSDASDSRSLGSPACGGNAANLPCDFSTVTNSTALMVSNVDADAIPGLARHLQRLPGWLRCEASLLRSQHISGMTSPQVYIKSAGAWTGAHQENILASSININHGPGTSQWACVPHSAVSRLLSAIDASKAAEHEPVSSSPAPSSSSAAAAAACPAPVLVQQANHCSKAGELDHDSVDSEGRFFLTAAWLRSRGIPHTWFEQRAGDAVVINGACMHWVAATGHSIHTSWNILRPVDLPLAAARAAQNEATGAPLVAPLVNALVCELRKLPPRRRMRHAAASSVGTTTPQDSAPLSHPRVRSPEAPWESVAVEMVAATARREFDECAAAKRAGLPISQAPDDSGVFRCDVPGCMREMVFAFACVNGAPDPVPSDPAPAAPTATAPDDEVLPARAPPARKAATKRFRRASPSRGAAPAGVWAGGHDAMNDWRLRVKRCRAMMTSTLALPPPSRTGRFLSRSRGRERHTSPWRNACAAGPMLVCVTCGLQARVKHRLPAQVYVNTRAVKALASIGRITSPSFASLMGH